MYCFISLAVYVHLHAWMDAAAEPALQAAVTLSRGEVASRIEADWRGSAAKRRCMVAAEVCRVHSFACVYAHTSCRPAQNISYCDKKYFLHKAQPSGCAYTCLSRRRSQSGRPRPVRRGAERGRARRARRGTPHATRTRTLARARSARGNLSPNARQPQVPGDGVRLLHSCKLCQRRTRAGERRASLYR